MHVVDLPITRFNGNGGVSSCVQGAVEAAFADDLNLVEVEFPPLDTDYLEDSGSSAYDVSSANVRLASRFAQSFAAEGKVFTQQVYQVPYYNTVVHVMYSAVFYCIVFTQ